ncbi:MULTISPECIES: DUF2946 domain-containing protein [unclassified Methylobacterium]|uniref:DUF2946 domain-containing protein n=1 Tax=unclassified Methylobacterium TaxID=2615210 RepID=UPI0013559EEB|nr:DUF2946 domain-containing protein [Methylobacterium sp. 2A]
MRVPFTSGSPHRRPHPLGVALIALALWVQALAPVGALRMMLGPPGNLPPGILCGHGPDQAEPVSLVDRQGQTAPACALCQLCRAGLAPPPVPDGPTCAHKLRWHSVAWPIPPPVRASLEFHRSADPRAPPTTA